MWWADGWSRSVERMVETHEGFGMPFNPSPASCKAKPSVIFKTSHRCSSFLFPLWAKGGSGRFLSTVMRKAHQTYQRDRTTRGVETRLLGAEKSLSRDQL